MIQITVGIRLPAIRSPEPSSYWTFTSLFFKDQNFDLAEAEIEPRAPGGFPSTIWAIRSYG